MDDDHNLDDAYTDLEVRVRSVPIDATKETIEQFTELITESNELVKKAKATDEVLKDAGVVQALASSIYESAKCVNISESNFDPSLFALGVVRLISNVEEEEDEGVRIDWTKLSHLSKNIYKYAPGLTYISAYKGDQPSTQVQKIVEKRARQTKKQLEQRKEPEKVKTITKSDDGVQATEHIHKLLTRCYRQNKENPICFFQFVTDPSSFSKTVENIFHVSFLARDGAITMSLDHRKLPVLTPIPQGNINNNTKHKDKVQLLVSLTQSQWQAIVRAFNITSAVIP